MTEIPQRLLNTGIFGTILRKMKVNVFLNANENEKTLGLPKGKRLLTKIIYNARKFLKLYL